MRRFRESYTGGEPTPLATTVEMKATMAISGRHWNAPDISATSAVPAEGRPHRAREQAYHAEHEIRGKLRFGGKTVSDEQGPAHGADHAADGEHGHEQAAGHAGGEAQDGEDDLDEQEERHRAEQERAVGREPAEIGCGIAEAHEHLRIDVQQDTAEQEGQERLEGAGTSFWWSWNSVTRSRAVL